MINGPVHIIIPPVWSAVYLNTARLLKYSLEDQGCQVFIIEAGERQAGHLSIVLGWNLIPEEVALQQPYIIYQLEPMSIPLWRDKLRQKMKLFQNAEIIWDYAPSNAQYLNELGLRTSLLSLGYHPKMEEVPVSEFPDYDVLFVGFLTERRIRIIDELQKHCCVSIQPRWGKDFTDAIGRSKIFLNVHQYDIPTSLEQARISYALNNHAFVITEVSADNPYEHLLSCRYEDLTETTLFFLNNRKERIERGNLVFRSFSKFRMNAPELLIREIANDQMCKFIKEKI
jgi:hypothetical protein